MAIATTQSDFRDNIKHYLDLVNNDSETVFIARTKQRGAAVIDQHKLDWLERYAKSRPGSLEHAIAEDKLKEYGIIPDNDPILKDDKEYNKFWEQFK